MQTYKSFDELPDERRHELKAYRAVTNSTCLECGYSGLMGRITVVPWYLSWWLWLPLIGVACLLFANGALMSIVIGAVVGVVVVLFYKKLLYCPSCRSTLTPR